MKYKTTIIKEDKELLRNIPDTFIAKLTGYSHSYISLLRHGKRIAPEATYKKIKKTLDKYVTI